MTITNKILCLRELLQKELSLMLKEQRTNFDKPDIMKELFKRPQDVGRVLPRTASLQSKFDWVQTTEVDNITK